MPRDSDRSARRRSSGVCAIGSVVCLGLAGAFPAHAQELDWSTSADGSGFDLGKGIATTPRGNSYVTGRFSGTAIFGPGEPNETTLTSAGSFDIFVAKYDRDGVLLWATRAGGVGSEVSGGIEEASRRRPAARAT
jgi:hypothetical protein